MQPQVSKAQTFLGFRTQPRHIQMVLSPAMMEAGCLLVFSRRHCQSVAEALVRWGLRPGLLLFVLSAACEVSCPPPPPPAFPEKNKNRHLQSPTLSSLY